MSEGLHLSQMSLVSAILSEIGRQCPNAALPPCRVLNLVCRSASEIVSEAAIPFRPATKGMGLQRWLECDDTGLSSKYMAHVLYGAPRVDFNYPRDADDYGRCERLLIACGEPEPSKWLDLAQHPEWLETISKLERVP